jgi:hypothetical protein
MRGCFRCSSFKPYLHKGEEELSTFQATSSIDKLQASELVNAPVHRSFDVQTDLKQGHMSNDCRASLTKAVVLNQSAFRSPLFELYFEEGIRYKGDYSCYRAKQCCCWDNVNACMVKLPFRWLKMGLRAKIRELRVRG